MATTSEASRLQKGMAVMRIKWISVGLVAMLGLSACGVGVDDPEGQAAAAAAGAPVTGTNEQALAVGPDGYPVGVPNEVPGAVVLPNGGTQMLPQDPVPIHGPKELVVLPPQAATVTR